MRKEEEGSVGMDGAKEPTATNVQLNYMACHPITCDPIPWAAITTLLPRLCFGIRSDAIGITIPRTGIVNRKGLLKVEQSKGLVMRAQWFSGIRDRKRGGKKLRWWEEEKKTEKEKFRHHSSQSNREREWWDERNGDEYTPIYMQMIHGGKLLGNFQLKQRNPNKTFLLQFPNTSTVMSFEREVACYGFCC